MAKKEKEKKRRLDEGQGPSGAAKSTEGQQPVDPLPHPTEVIFLDNTSPPGQVIDEEKKAREAAEKKAAALEVELSHIDGRWRRELEIRDDQIMGLKSHRSKQSAAITELEDKDKCLKREIARWDARIKYLDEEVEVQKRHRLAAQEQARSDRWVANKVKIDLKEERATHEAAQATVLALEACVISLDSQAHTTKVIEEYRHNPLGKVKVALACKAGFDYLASLLPPESRPVTDSDYPPRVAICIDFLKEVEMAGGGVTLEVDEGENNDSGDDYEEAPPTMPPAT